MKQKEKYLSYAWLLDLPSSVLFRMRNCQSYFDSLCEKTQATLSDLLNERYSSYLFNGGDLI